MEQAQSTQVVRVEDPGQNREGVKLAAGILRRGGLVVFPTETVYGIGANALDSAAVADIFRAKGRPQDNPLIVHICTLEDGEELASSFPASARRLAERFWPGPLTVILPKSPRIPPEVSGGLDTVALRMPSHPVARAIIREAGVPVAAPSANRSGSPSPTRADHCIADLSGRVDLIVDGGECPVGLESTVLSLAGDRPRLLRPGAVTLEELREILGDVEVDPAVLHRLEEGVAAASPGMKYRHYAPALQLVLAHGSPERFWALLEREPEAAGLVFDGDVAAWNRERLVSYGGEHDSAAQARELFQALRALDGTGAVKAYARPPAITGLGLAVYNRLLRAAGFQEIYLEKQGDGNG